MSSMNQHGSTRLWVVALVAASVLTGAAVWHAPSVAEDKTTPPVPPTIAHKAEQSFAKALSHAFRSAADAAMPSVVTVMSETRTRQVKGNGRTGENPFKGTPYEDLFKDFQGRGIPFSMPAPERRAGVGAGVIIDKSGIILTNNHVVEGATEVTVRLSDGREFEGYDIKTDKSSDLAVVRIKGAGDLPAATLGDSDNLSIGDWVIAVGNPFNQEMTVSAGIISGKGRTLPSGQRAQYLQTDAAINPGNSGGPLVDLDGEVVGINTAIASSSGGFQGVGFAIPINQAKWVADQLVHGGAVKRAYVGVVVGEISGDLAEQFGVHRHDGVFVNEVIPNSPAAKAGLQEGDIITEFGGKHVGTPGQLQQLVERTPLSSKEDLAVLRDGKPLALRIGVEAMPDEPQIRNVGGSHGDHDPRSFTSDQLGLEVADLKPEEAEQLGYKDVKGVVITNVDPDGLAAEHGLADGMLIKKVGKKEVTSVEDFKKAMADESTEKGVLLLVRTSAGNRFVVLKK
ncbi:MAG TPA: Do family serine endopeptidase [Pirellulales bacterium]|nr:Do family serine endopeptidase [Pirellulales bacterium]